MPQKLERLWTDKEIDHIEDTITALRKIRSAAVLGLEPPKTGVIGLLANLRGQLPVPEDRQRVLSDGEDLAHAAAAFLAKRVVKGERDVERRDAWEEVLLRTTEHYGRYPVTTFAKTSRNEVSQSTIFNLRAMSIDPRYMLNCNLFRENRLGAIDLNSLLAARLVVVAPLSGDLLLAAIHREQVELTRGQSFHLRTAAISKDLKHTVISDLKPEMEQGFQAVGIFLDAIESGSTGRVLATSLRDQYPQFTVHEPQTSRVEFVPSQKIRRALVR